MPHYSNSLPANLTQHLDQMDAAEAISMMPHATQTGRMAAVVPHTATAETHLPTVSPRMAVKVDAPLPARRQIPLCRQLKNLLSVSQRDLDQAAAEA